MHQGRDARVPVEMMRSPHDIVRKTLHDAHGETVKRRIAKKSPIRPKARRARAISIRGERHRTDRALPVRGPGAPLEGGPAFDALAWGGGVPPWPFTPFPVGFSPFHGPV